MATPATEIATIPLSAGANIEDPSSAAGKVWQATLDTVSQQDGYQRAYYGREVENQSVLQFFVDWDSYESHKKFIASPGYGPFAKHLMTIVDGPLSMMHASFTPHPPSAALSHTTSPVTEVLTCYFNAKDDNYEKNIEKLIAVVKDNTDDFKAGSAGWVLEDVEHESIGSGKKGKAFVAVFGWESVDAHQKFRETQCCKDNIHLVRDGRCGVEVHHTVFTEK
ncbi:hypothetical protein P7C71_g3776, partial [Lecanoromycetidae sp. Uapishka_2]